MGKTKSSEKGHYELLYIIPNKYTEDEATGIDAKVQKIITDKEGEITYSENWGKKKMAHSIKGYNHGYYILHEFDLEGKYLIDVDKLFRMSSEVLRHQIVKTKKRTLEEIKKEKEVEKKTIEKEEKEKEEEEVKKEEVKVKVEKPKVSEEKPKEEDKKKVDLKDLDKKLDDILDSSDLL